MGDTSARVYLLIADTGQLVGLPSKYTSLAPRGFRA